MARLDFRLVRVSIVEVGRNEVQELNAGDETIVSLTENEFDVGDRHEGKDP